MSGDVERRIRRLEWCNATLVVALLVVGGAAGWRSGADEVDAPTASKWWTPRGARAS